MAEADSFFLVVFLADLVVLLPLPFILEDVDWPRPKVGGGWDFEKENNPEDEAGAGGAVLEAGAGAAVLGAGLLLLVTRSAVFRLVGSKTRLDIFDLVIVIVIIIILFIRHG